MLAALRPWSEREYRLDKMTLRELLVAYFTHYSIQVYLLLAVVAAGLAAYTKIFADTHAADNIRMNNVLPGWIDSLPGTEERRTSVPMQRYGSSEEIAATIAFLVSEGAGYITGQNIRVDGGLTRSV